MHTLAEFFPTIFFKNIFLCESISSFSVGLKRIFQVSGGLLKALCLCSARKPGPAEVDKSVFLNHQLIALTVSHVLKKTYLWRTWRRVG
jgi:hypothetical protein